MLVSTFNSPRLVVDRLLFCNVGYEAAWDESDLVDEASMRCVASLRAAEWPRGGWQTCIMYVFHRDTLSLFSETP